MTGILVNVACKREIHSRTKVKTGCATCRLVLNHIAGPRSKTEDQDAIAVISLIQH